ncbi:MAG TPA: TRAP transporter small permease subunit [Stellaceae bacterium]|nr:TRAP transporter small permease subunit [Stellaceae bacterium]
MIARLRAALDLAIQWIAFGLIGTLLVVVMLGVVTRALGDPLIWTDEASRFLMVWLAVFGWLLATRRRAHIRIRFFHDLLPRGAWRAAEVVIQASVALMGIMVGWFAVDLVRRNADMFALTLPLSLAWMYVPMLLAGAVTFAQAAVDAGAALGRSPLPPAPGEERSE